MKYFKIALLLVLLAVISTNISCERDDICPESTPTTPKLIIEFYNTNEPENLKAIARLRVQGINNDNVLPGYNIVNTTKIELPLRTDTIATQYKLHSNYSINDNGTPNDTSDDFPDGNEDVITIKYNPEQIFVSRACGYKTIFNNLSLTIDQDDDNWILSRQSVNDNQSVEDETTVHFYLFH